MTIDPSKFVTMASPVAWYETAEELHEQAIALVKFDTAHKGYFDGEKTTWFPACNRAAFLLGGFALENLLKAFLVYENPHWVSNGKLCKKLRSHDLTQLQALSVHVPYKNRLLWVLKGFEDGLESWSRYPCALSAEETRPIGNLTAELWRGYERLTSAYGNRLRHLLAKTWNGPHGSPSHVEFRGLGGTMGRQGFKPHRRNGAVARNSA